MKKNISKDHKKYDYLSTLVFIFMFLCIGYFLCFIVHIDDILHTYPRYICKVNYTENGGIPVCANITEKYYILDRGSTRIKMEYSSDVHEDINIEEVSNWTRIGKIIMKRKIICTQNDE